MSGRPERVAKSLSVNFDTPMFLHSFNLCVHPYVCKANDKECPRENLFEERQFSGALPMLRLGQVHPVESTYNHKKPMFVNSPTTGFMHIRAPPHSTLPSSASFISAPTNQNGIVYSFTNKLEISLLRYSVDSLLGLEKKNLFVVFSI